MRTPGAGDSIVRGLILKIAAEEVPARGWRWGCLVPVRGLGHVVVPQLHVVSQLHVVQVPAQTLHQAASVLRGIMVLAPATMAKAPNYLDPNTPNTASTPELYL